MKLRTLLALLAACSAAAFAVISLQPEPPETRRPAGARSEERARTDRASAAGANVAWPVEDLEIRVRGTDGAAVADVPVLLESETRSSLAGYEIADSRGVQLDARTNAEGVARFPSLPVGPYAISGEGADGRRFRRAIVLATGRGAVDVALAEGADPGDLVVRVVDAAGGDVAGARVDVQESVDEPAVTGRSDEHGLVRFDRIERGGVVARHPDGRVGLAAVPEEPGEVVVRLAPPGILEGSIDLPPERSRHARVLAQALGAAISTPVVDGRYRFADLPEGSWTLSLADPGGARLDDVSASTDALVTSGTSTVRDLQVVVGGAIEGVVLAGPKLPVVGAIVRVASRRTRTDASGRYRIVGLPPGRHRLEVLAPGLSYDARDGIELEDGARMRFDHYLEPAGTILGVDPRSGHVGVTREGRDTAVVVAELPADGSFAFGGLAAGRYVISRFDPDPPRAREALATVDVEAGRTTWIDLTREDRAARLLGRVVDARGGVGGARVRVRSEPLTTDDLGRFELRSSSPFELPITVRVERGGVETIWSLPEAPAREEERVFALGDGSLAVKTLDAEGEPVPARVEMAATRLDPGSGDVPKLRFEPFFVDESGERTVSGLYAGAYALRARFANGSEARATARSPDVSVLELRMPPSGRLTVTVRAAGGGPELGRWVSIEPSTSGPDADGRLRWGETDVDGRVVFHGIAPGEVLVRVQARSRSSDREGTLAEERVTIEAGTEKSLELEIRER